MYLVHSNDPSMKPVLRSLSILRRKAAYAWQDTRALLGPPRSLEAARGARIVVYHGICLRKHLQFNNIFLLRSIFERHLQIYKRYFNVVSLDDYYAGRFSRDRFNICIHFDDGYANQLHYVLPLLDQYELPASFFITAIREAGYDILWNDFLGMLNKYGPQELTFRDELFRKRRGIFPSYASVTRGIGLWEMLLQEGFAPKAALMKDLGPLVPFRDNRPIEDFWLQLTGDQIKQLASSGRITIGAHGYYHNDLSKVSPAEAEQEIIGCKRYLENLTGRDITAFAFPYGRYNAASLEAARKAGFSQILPLAIRQPDPLLRERFIINPYVSVTNQLLNIIRKRYDFWR